ncbi:cell differentiation protein rcd1 isoform X3 [Lactuca sativa]|uniref:cell differentiation protein rcd1 isoform X3 n=1 Tax=Lactuca sativa TaxID=4236 RepID=UPI001C68F71F|nr:cell differentiation protein rcd1 isoform X3 [Lactuca sativa]
MCVKKFNPYEKLAKPRVTYLENSDVVKKLSSNPPIQLQGKGGCEVGLLLWNSRDAIFSLFEELLWVYKLVSPLKLGMAEATRVCNALALVQEKPPA